LGYLRPAAIEDAVAALAAHPATLLAGGTDFFPARVGRAVEPDIVDLTGIAALRGIARTEAGYRFGACTTWTDLLRADLPPAFDGLRAAARAVGGVQVQNAGTLGGNLCNASPAADGTPNWLALDASAELASVRGVRTLPVEEFVLGNRRTARVPDEALTAITVPQPAAGARGTFLKLGAREYLVISIVMVGAVLMVVDGKVAQARIAVGACGPAPARLPDAEAALLGHAPDPMRITAAHLAALSPIDDVRGSAAYRRDAALTLVRRAVAGFAA
jgi:CO/xanthine dehydrogenase FAD-binding subunit